MFRFKVSAPNVWIFPNKCLGSQIPGSQLIGTLYLHLEKFSIAKQKIAEEWAEVQNAKQSLFDIVKPDAFAKYEDNIRAAARKFTYTG